MKKNFIILLLCLLVSGIVNCILGPGCDWDFLSYHYYNAYAVLHNRIGYDLMPADFQSYLNPFLDIINYSVIKVFYNYKYLLIFIQGLHWGLFSFVIYLISDLLFKKVSNDKYINYAIILFSTIIGATECIVVSEIGLSHNDITSSIPVLFSLYFILKFFLSQKNKYIIFSGLLIGVACGFKQTQLLFFTSLLLTFILLNLKRGIRYNLKYSSLYMLFAMIGFLIINGYWMLLLYKKFGSPFSPMFNAIFKSKYYAFENYKDLRYGDIHSIKQILFYPLIWSWKETSSSRVNYFPFFDYRHSFAYFSCLFGLIIYIYRSKLKKYISYIDKAYIYIILFSIISYFLFIISSGILRYFMPVLSLCGVQISICLINLNLIKKNRIIVIETIILLGLILNYNYLIPKEGRSSQILELSNLPIKENSVVFLKGKPISYVAANSKYKNVRFIFLYDRAYDGQSLKFIPSEEYYKLIDKIIKNKKKYLIVRYKLSPKENNEKCILMQEKRYLNKKKKCTKIEDITKNTFKPCRTDNFLFCEYLE